MNGVVTRVNLQVPGGVGNRETGDGPAVRRYVELNRPAARVGAGVDGAGDVVGPGGGRGQHQPDRQREGDETSDTRVNASTRCLGIDNPEHGEARGADERHLRSLFPSALTRPEGPPVLAVIDRRPRSLPPWSTTLWQRTHANW